MVRIVAEQPYGGRLCGEAVRLGHDLARRQQTTGSMAALMSLAHGGRNGTLGPAPDYSAMSYRACASDVSHGEQKLGAKVVKQRGASMAAAAGACGRPHGMLSVIGLGDEALEALCGAGRARQPPGTVCQVANHLFPTGRVVSGHKDALAEARARLAPRKPAGRARHAWHRACQPWMHATGPCPKACVAPGRAGARVKACPALAGGLVQRREARH